MDGLPETEGAATPPAESSPAAPPRDEGKRARAAAKQQVKRLLKRAEAAEGKEEMWKILSDLADKEGAKLAQPAAAADGEVKTAADVAPPSNWPTPEQTAAALPMTLQLWDQVAVQLIGTPFELGSKEQRVPVPKPDGSGVEFQAIKVDAVVVLGQGTAPLAAHLMGKMSALTPWTAAALCVVGVFGPPAAGLAINAARNWWLARKGAPAKVAAAAPLAVAAK